MAPYERTDVLEELQIIVGWIVTSYLPCLEFLQDLSTEHIPHACSAQTVLKSNMNKLGLLEKDEIITDDMIDIMATMQNTVLEQKVERW